MWDLSARVPVILDGRSQYASGANPQTGPQCPIIPYPTCPSPVSAECAVLLQITPVHHTCQLCTDTSDLLGSLKEQEMLTFQQSFPNATLQAMQVTHQ